MQCNAAFCLARVTCSTFLRDTNLKHEISRNVQGLHLVSCYKLDRAWVCPPVRSIFHSLKVDRRTTMPFHMQLIRRVDSGAEAQYTHVIQKTEGNEKYDRVNLYVKLNIK